MIPEFLHHAISGRSDLQQPEANQLNGHRLLAHLKLVCEALDIQVGQGALGALNSGVFLQQRRRHEQFGGELIRLPLTGVETRRVLLAVENDVST
ncbi:MAG: hypothetical protein MUC96_30035, partial [Myxococcaceae bacterium]|nr:hypothetical protein [Myxococcaceae bacterium]